MNTFVCSIDIIDIGDRPRRGSTGGPDLFKKPLPPGQKNKSDLGW